MCSLLYLFDESFCMTNETNKIRINRDEVYSLISKIPKGSVSTYGDIARALGHPKSARAVGAILGRNPNPIVVPCHRVVEHNGRIGGYSLGIRMKEDLLCKEGLKLQNDVIQDLERHRVSFLV
jgi:methylated-DNA-[protein]-cysteine S-methyltransferase